MIIVLMKKNIGLKIQQSRDILKIVLPYNVTENFIEEIFKKVSEFEKPKLVNVTGNNNNADANIAGITPAVFILSGK